MKKTQSIVSKRRDEILDLLKSNNNIKNDELAELLRTSPLTIRRDLQALEEKGLVKRYYGGAIPIYNTNTSNNNQSDPSLKYENHKKAIAKYAASLIKDGDTIFMNSASTALLILDYLENKRVVVVTNNGKALNSTLGPNVELVLTGGQVYGRKQSMVGDFATHILTKITASKCFLGVSGIAADSGISTSVLQETLVNKEMINHCKGPVYVLADNSKVGRNFNFSSGDINQISHLITDSDVSADNVLDFEARGVTVIKVNCN